LSKTLLILRTTVRDIIQEQKSSCKAPVILVIFLKNAQISNFMLSCPVGAEFSHVDGRTERIKLIISLRNFSKVPKNYDV
jgi:hypothetical protein